MDQVHSQIGNHKQLGRKQGGNIGLDLTPTFCLQKVNLCNVQMVKKTKRLADISEIVDHGMQLVVVWIVCKTYSIQILLQSGVVTSNWVAFSRPL